MSDKTERPSAMMTPEEIAEELKVSERTVRRMLVTGQMNCPFIRFGKQIRVQRRDFDEWVESRKMSGDTNSGGRNPEF